MEGKRILVVEDEQTLQGVIMAKLKTVGVEGIGAKSVEEAKQILEKESVNAIWLDHYLLGAENGLDFVAYCKTEGSTCERIPIFVVTNTAGIEKKQTYLQLGVNKFYVKAQVSLEEIVNEIHSAIE